MPTMTTYNRTTQASTGNGSKVQCGLSGASTAAPAGIEVKADSANAGVVWVSTSSTLTTGGGGGAATTDGWPLAAGNTLYLSAKDINGDANNLYAAGDANSQKLHVRVLGN